MQQRYPTIPRLVRVCDKDSQLGGYPVTKGVRANFPFLCLLSAIEAIFFLLTSLQQDIVLFIHGMTSNPRWFPNPEKYDPSRFENHESETQSGTIPPYPPHLLSFLSIVLLISLNIRTFRLE